MSSFELLELFGVEIIEPKGELRSVRVQGDTPGHLRVMRIFPKDACRVIRVDFTPEEGELAKVMRGGERAEWKQAVCQTANTSAILRAVHAPDAQPDEYGEKLFFPIAKQREFAAESERLRDEELRTRSEVFDDDGMASMWTLKEVG